MALTTTPSTARPLQPLLHSAVQNEPLGFVTCWSWTQGSSEKRQLSAVTRCRKQQLSSWKIQDAERSASGELTGASWQLIPLVPTPCCCPVTPVIFVQAAPTMSLRVCEVKQRRGSGCST